MKKLISVRHARAGILHKEFHEGAFSSKGQPFETVQLWVNLTRKSKSVKAHCQAITQAQTGKVKYQTTETSSTSLQVISMKWSGQQRPIRPSTYLISKRKRRKITMSVSERHHTALLGIHGNLAANGEAGEHDFVLFENKGNEMTLASKDCVVLVLSGAPIASYSPL